MMNQHCRKSERKKEILRILKHHEDGLSAEELIHLLTTNQGKRTLQRDLKELMSHNNVGNEGTHYFFLSDEGRKLDNIELSPDEAFTLYLAGRMLFQLRDRRDETTIQALSKLVGALSEEADMNVSDLLQDTMREFRQKENKDEFDYDRTFAILTRCLLTKKRCSIQYKPLQGRSFETDFDLYHIEPFPIGNTLHLIGYSHAPKALRTYRINRIQHIEQTTTEFFTNLEHESKIHQMLQESWGVPVHDDKEPVEIQLWFSEQVSPRIQETFWHKTQRIDPQTDGSLLFSVIVGSTIDFVPWIRSWGADCEVISPISLRDQVIGHVRGLMRVYGIDSDRDDASFMEDMFG